MHGWVSHKCLVLTSERHYYLSFINRLAEGCSHVAAILFKVECAVRLGYTSVTSQACQWNDVYCKKVSIVTGYLGRKIF